MLKRISTLVLLVTITTQALAGFPPSTTKSATDTNAVVTFNNVFPFPMQHSGITANATTTFNQAPSKNYVTNANFENNSVSQWSAVGCATITNGLPACNGTGSNPFSNSNGGRVAGANTNAPAVDATGQIEGTYALNFTTAGPGTIGDGYISSQYTIDPKDRGKVLGFSLNYLLVSGTANLSGTSSNTFAIAIYDTFNNTWIAPAGAFNFVQSSGVGRATGTFQAASNSTTFQIFIYNPVAPTGTVSFLIDQVFLGPQVTPQAPAMSDFQPYTMTIGGTTTAPTLGTTAVNTAYWKREGQYMTIQYTVQQTAAGTAGSGAYLFSLPPGYQIDTNYVTLSTGFGATNFGTLNTAVAYGSASYTTLGNTAAAGIITGYAYSSTQIVFNSTQTITGPYAVMYPVGSGNFSISNAAFTLSFTARVPIVGWSSNSVASSDTDTRVIAASANTLSSTTITAGTALKWTTVSYDTSASYNSTTGGYTAPVSGYYKFTVSGMFTSAGGGSLSVYKNGSSVIGLFASYNGTMKTAASTEIQLSAGDVVTIVPDTSATAGATVGFLFVERLSGPAVINAVESVNARYSDTSGQAIGTSAAVFKFGTKTFDSHNAYNTSTGLYTVPVSGKYRASAKWATTTIANDVAYVYIYLNGSLYSAFHVNQQGATAVYTPTTISDDISCNTGDTIAIYAASSAATTATTQTGYNTFAIERIGN